MLDDVGGTGWWILLWILEQGGAQIRCKVTSIHELVGGLEHDFLWLSIQLGMSSSQLTFVFFRGIETTNQNVFMRLLWTNKHNWGSSPRRNVENSHDFPVGLMVLGDNSAMFASQCNKCNNKTPGGCVRKWEHPKMKKTAKGKMLRIHYLQINPNGFLRANPIL